MVTELDRVIQQQTKKHAGVFWC